MKWKKLSFPFLVSVETSPECLEKTEEVAGGGGREGRWGNGGRLKR
jgi:hypothetical protein